MNKSELLSPHVDHLLKTMEQICHDLAWGRYDRAEELFNLTRSRSYPEPIVNLAESFGMMLVKVEAREYGLEQLVTELKQTKDALEAAQRQLLKENANLKHGLMERFSPKRIVGQSPGIRSILDQIERIADTSVNVLISGETGTGKELVAKSLHYSSQRRVRPFMAVNCSAIPESLFESELFGIEKGVATGVTMRRGLLEQAHGGTLLLDEIGDMPLAFQGKILRVLEEREVTRLGGTKPIPVDIRIVAATNRDLQSEIKAGRFRQDLYFRLNVVSIKLPPLRERPEDIPLLLRRFLEHHCSDMKRPMPRISKEALEAILKHDWPGNVRELENEVERLVALSSSPTVRLEDLSAMIRDPAAHDILPSLPLATEWLDFAPIEPVRKSRKTKPALQNLADSEANLIINALKAANGNKTKAARLLGISREGLRKKLKKMDEAIAS